MPMIDLLCQKCENRFEKFFHPSQVVDEFPCEAMAEDGTQCSGTAKVFYFAPRRPSWAQRFSPVVIHRDPEGNIRFPGHADAPVPEGFQKVELTDIHQIRKLEREVNHHEDEKSEEFRLAKANHFRQKMKEQRDSISAIVAKMSPRGRRFYEAMREASDARTSKKERGHAPSSNFFIEAFSQDASNREAYRDERTGWRSGGK